MIQLPTLEQVDAATAAVQKRFDAAIGDVDESTSLHVSLCSLDTLRRAINELTNDAFTALDVASDAYPA
jgi:hypothetical protein